MKIENISHLNLDNLYQVIFEKENDPNYKLKEFGSNFETLLSHLNITFKISEITKIEYFYLKRFASRVSKFVLEENEEINNEYLENNFSEIIPKVKQFREIFSTIKEDCKVSGEILPENIENFYVPTGLLLGSCYVIFEGIHLISLIELDPRNFFLKATSNNEETAKCLIKEEGKEQPSFDPSLIDNFFVDERVKMIESYLIQRFYTEFYNFMRKNATEIDLASDAFNSSIFMKSKGVNDVAVYNVTNPYIALNFREDNSEDIKNAILEFKKLKISKKDIIRETKIEFNCELNFSVFLELINILPNYAINSMDSISYIIKKSLDPELVPGVDNIENVKQDLYYILKNYSKRFFNRISSLTNTINEKYGQNKSEVFKHIELINGYTPIRFCMTLSFDDINTYLNPKEIDTYGNDYTGFFISKFSNKVSKLAINILSVLI